MYFISSSVVKYFANIMHLRFKIRTQIIYKQPKTIVAMIYLHFIRKKVFRNSHLLIKREKKQYLDVHTWRWWPYVNWTAIKHTIILQTFIDQRIIHNAFIKFDKTYLAATYYDLIAKRYMSYISTVITRKDTCQHRNCISVS